jgi:hypothetical protein
MGIQMGAGMGMNEREWDGMGMKKLSLHFSHAKMKLFMLMACLLCRIHSGLIKSNYGIKHLFRRAIR